MGKIVHNGVILHSNVRFAHNNGLLHVVSFNSTDKWIAYQRLRQFGGSKATYLWGIRSNVLTRHVPPIIPTISTDGRCFGPTRPLRRKVKEMLAQNRVPLPETFFSGLGRFGHGLPNAIFIFHPYVTHFHPVALHVRREDVVGMNA